MPAKGGDVELTLSFPNSLAPSIRMDDDTDSTVPAISAAQRAVYRRKFLLAFLPLCFSVFVNGWNDGTNGPLLPRIQEYYNVSVGEGWTLGRAPGGRVRVDRVRRLGLR